MPSFIDWKNQVATAQQQLSQLMQDTTDLSKTQLQFQQYQELLHSGVKFAEDSESYGLFLREQLDWLQQQMVLFEAEKVAAAAELLQLERRKKAKSGYDQNT
ncbi:hypothetical protein [Alkalimonas amylolytica]|uniref:Uncharacterized protein n=1 Tax=Alkalimonas amylolytica TaxID=152573 RepID=A0A1H4B8U3_ALKAM|nr:hypothetical protein [Alkalimonas amylolytica]SEA44570.1 hypothetical protein SAMN04488051_103234 [Alkalimonas amylolytica]